MNSNEIKKLIIILFAYFTVAIVPKIRSLEKEDSIKYNDNYNKESICFAEFDNKKVFIGNEEIIESLIDINDNNIYIIDKRDMSDPNMSVRNSFKISSKEEMKSIIKIIQEYNSRYPSNWNRSYYSAYNEMLSHYYGYKLNIKKESATHTDLNNRDENIYNNSFMTYLLK